MKIFCENIMWKYHVKIMWKITRKFHVKIFKKTFWAPPREHEAMLTRPPFKPAMAILNPLPSTPRMLEAKNDCLAVKSEPTWNTTVVKVNHFSRLIPPAHFVLIGAKREARRAQID